MVKCYHQLLYCNRVKAVDPLKLDPTSMSNIYKVIDMLHMQWIEEDRPYHHSIAKEFWLEVSK